jgi:acyl-CoA thioesterase FadM
VEVVLETVVRCTDSDVNGHVKNAKCVEYLEWGREDSTAAAVMAPTVNRCSRRRSGEVALAG